MLKISDLTPTATADGHWTNGNVAGGVSPTIMDAGWFNAVQDELINVLALAGITPDQTDSMQVAKALKRTFVPYSSFEMIQSGSNGSNSGYQKLPSGLIIQWISANGINSTGTTALPIVFPNATLFAIVTDAVANSSASFVGVAWNIGATTKASVGWIGNGSPGAFCIMAIGY
ncbi:gp53-like domain-containing protein [Erwinia amylovora]|uniref:gp53-like domain-containing protein n=1 Tax=Erwinia amylovora TaxID=552 RepID=UPI0014447E53|nr:hypothetical protein [Erwinia amylovora]